MKATTSARDLHTTIPRGRKPQSAVPSDDGQPFFAFPCPSPRSALASIRAKCMAMKEALYLITSWGLARLANPPAPPSLEECALFSESEEDDLRSVFCARGCCSRASFPLEPLPHQRPKRGATHV